MKSMSSSLPIRFKQPEFHHFSWIFGSAPCFPIRASKINIITDPNKFYDTLCERFKYATRRITVASLYIGVGALEGQLLEIIKGNLMRNENLTFHILLDYQRGTRGAKNSLSLLREFVNNVPDQCNVAMYQTPRLHGQWSRMLPSRYNELIGLQHMKLYITDDKVLLSGANCSNDYFQQRQDRYIEIENGDLADFYCELIDEVSCLSKKYVKDGTLSNDICHDDSKTAVVKEGSVKIANFLEKWRKRQESKLLSLKNDMKHDTWVFPLIQMGEFNIKQDEMVTMGLLESAPRGSYFRLATGYFNLTDQYTKTLLKDCKAYVSLLMAHPTANGFLGASGPAGGIPHAYSLIASKFWERVQETNQTSRIRMLEYQRMGWTFHAKGLWYYPAGSDVPWATLVGSANLGERSVRRDLEAQAAIFTTSHQLQVKLHEECSMLHAHASECAAELRERRPPLWVRATVGLFRTYF